MVYGLIYGHLMGFMFWLGYIHHATTKAQRMAMAFKRGRACVQWSMLGIETGVHVRAIINGRARSKNHAKWGSGGKARRLMSIRPLTICDPKNTLSYIRVP